MRNVAAILLFVIIACFFFPWTYVLGRGFSFLDMVVISSSGTGRGVATIYIVLMFIALAAGILALCKVNVYRWIAIPLSILILSFSLVNAAAVLENGVEFGFGLIFTVICSIALFVVAIIEGVQSRRARKAAGRVARANFW